MLTVVYAGPLDGLPPHTSLSRKQKRTLSKHYHPYVIVNTQDDSKLALILHHSMTIHDFLELHGAEPDPSGFVPEE